MTKLNKAMKRAYKEFIKGCSNGGGCPECANAYKQHISKLTKR